ncbi:MAG: hypothetical protein Q8L02_02760 [Candidatus Nitrotoga sp.]|nr:hypothetical protein [Candidatus Nitrotoga sp.]
MSILVYAYATGAFSRRKLENVTFDSVAFHFVAADEHPSHQETGRTTARLGQEAYGAGRSAHQVTDKSYRNLDIRKMARSGCLPDGWFKGQ